ncbi:MAG: HesA/MoeB/ThiF family protein [Sphingomonadaceae bacterium]
MLLSPDRLERFSRQIILPEIGGAGQVALSGKHVVLVGLGGIGCPALQYLAGAGIGTITLVDDDDVALSNLQRQTIYRMEDLGRPKVEASAAWIRQFDPEITIHKHATRINAANAGSLLAGADLVLDGCDNFATRLTVSDHCVALAIPLLSAAVGRFQGQVACFAGHLPDQSCYRCFVGDAFDTDECDTCAEDGMLGAMAGWTGSFAAMQAVRLLLAGISLPEDPQWGTLYLLDGRAPSMRSITLPPDPACRTCGSQAG